MMRFRVAFYFHFQVYGKRVVRREEGLDCEHAAKGRGRCVAVDGDRRPVRAHKQDREHDSEAARE